MMRGDTMTRTESLLRRAVLGTLALALIFFLTTAQLGADEPASADPPPQWFKGNLHTHTLWSDGNHFPEMAAEWYRDRGYNFLALSDHNVLSRGERWVSMATIVKRGAVTGLDRYLERFGPEWVETRGSREDGTLAVRLKPLGEVRSLVEERGRFIMIESEEITDSFEKLPVHMNATNIGELIPPQHGASVRETIANNLNAVLEQSRRTGRPILAHLNHPNFGWAVTAEDLAHVTGERFFEVYNGHPGVRQPGDADHPSVDRIWDIANTLRIAELEAPPLFGLATDDTHHYHTEGMGRSMPGRGWIMVRTRRLTPESLIRAMQAGDFYASTGVTLGDVRFSPETGTLAIEIEPDGGAVFTTHFIGTTVGYDPSSEERLDAAGQPVRTTRRYDAGVGRVLATATGLSARYTLKGGELYVRARITSNAAPDRPSFKEQLEQAWTQPVGWRKRLEAGRPEPER